MEKATGKFKDELIQYKGELGIYIVEVYDPINDRKECWIMDQDKVIAKEPVGNTAFARLGEEVEKKYQELKAQYEDQRNEELIDEELMRRAEERLDKDRQRKRESYKWKIINEIKQGLEDMRNENGGGYNPYRYEIANIKSRADGKTLLIGFRDTDENGKTKRRHSVLIEEKENPDFFKEMMDKYMPQEEKNLDSKPF